MFVADAKCLQATWQTAVDGLPQEVFSNENLKIGQNFGFHHRVMWGESS